MMLTNLQISIEKRSARIGVIGLGYVGLPAASLFAEAGFKVTGIDIQIDRIQIINSGHSPIEGNEPGLDELIKRVVDSGNLYASSDYNDLREADIILIVVETPVDHTDHKPRYKSLRSACISLASVLKKGALVICESTVAPGTADNVIIPTLEEYSTLKVNRDFFVGVCPERVMPGRLLSNLINMSRVCGGSTPEVSQTMIQFYRTIVQSELDIADLITAELVKTTENAYRDVQIAFANEIAILCEQHGANIWQVRELVNKSPGRNMLMPGAGVGGHCIPKDPWLLISTVQPDLPIKLIPAARYVNDYMPVHVLSLLEKGLALHNIILKEARIAILGYSYLEDSDDTRNSPSEIFAQSLRDRYIDFDIHDPFVKEYNKNLVTVLNGADAVVMMVRHSLYVGLNLDIFVDNLRTPILVDGRNLYSSKEANRAGLTYLAIGRGDV